MLLEIDIDKAKAENAGFLYAEANGIGSFTPKDESTGPIRVAIVDGKWHFFPKRSGHQKRLLSALGVPVSD